MPEVAPVMSTTLPSNLRREKFAVPELFGAREFVAHATRDPTKPATVVPSSDRRPILLSFLSGKDFASSRFINSLVSTPTPAHLSSACSALLETVRESNPLESVCMRFACAAIPHAESPVSASRAIF
jgi:hypothetical protein